MAGRVVGYYDYQKHLSAISAAQWPRADETARYPLFNSDYRNRDRRNNGKHPIQTQILALNKHSNARIAVNLYCRDRVRSPFARHYPRTVPGRLFCRRSQEPGEISVPAIVGVLSAFRIAASLTRANRGSGRRDRRRRGRHAGAGVGNRVGVPPLWQRQRDKQP